MAVIKMMTIPVIESLLPSGLRVLGFRLTLSRHSFGKNCNVHAYTMKKISSKVNTMQRYKNVFMIESSCIARMLCQSIELFQTSHRITDPRAIRPIISTMETPRWNKIWAQDTSWPIEIQSLLPVAPLLVKPNRRAHIPNQYGEKPSRKLQLSNVWIRALW